MMKAPSLLLGDHKGRPYYRATTRVAPTTGDHKGRPYYRSMISLMFFSSVRAAIHCESLRCSSGVSAFFALT